MESGFVVLIAIAALIGGVAIGVLIAKIFKRPEETQGTVHAYYGDQDEQPSLLLEGSVPISDIVSRKIVLFNVVVVRR